jgi:hypothetical protein
VELLKLFKQMLVVCVLNHLSGTRAEKREKEEERENKERET